MSTLIKLSVEVLVSDDISPKIADAIAGTIKHNIDEYIDENVENLDNFVEHVGNVRTDANVIG